jgi:hypothetical protein
MRKEALPRKPGAPTSPNARGALFLESPGTVRASTPQGLVEGIGTSARTSMHDLPADDAEWRSGAALDLFDDLRKRIDMSSCRVVLDARSRVLKVDRNDVHTIDLLEDSSKRLSAALAHHALDAESRLGHR